MLINTVWEEKKEALGLTHYLKADGVEAEFITGKSDLITAAKVLKSYGPKEIIITHKGGVLVFDGDKIYQELFIYFILVDIILLFTELLEHFSLGIFIPQYKKYI